MHISPRISDVLCLPALAAYRGTRNAKAALMLLKFIALISAAIPLFLFWRAIMGRRQTKLGTALREFKQQIDLAIYIFIGIVGAIVAFAAGKLVWTWWAAM